MDLILWDIDDTLVGTGELFEGRINLLLRYLHKLVPEVGLEQLDVDFKRINAEAYGIDKVHTRRWVRVIGELGLLYGERVEKRRDECLDILKDIYSILPELKTGVRETLETFDRAGVLQGGGTHAFSGWTDFKVEGYGLNKYLKHIEVMDVLGVKDFRGWERAIKHFGVDPKRVMIVGDNKSGDVIAGRKAGVDRVVWVDLKKGWSVYRDGELPQGTWIVNGVWELVGIFSGLTEPNQV